MLSKQAGIQAGCQRHAQLPTLILEFISILAPAQQWLLHLEPTQPRSNAFDCPAGTRTVVAGANIKAEA